MLRNYSVPIVTFGIRLNVHAIVTILYFICDNVGCYKKKTSLYVSFILDSNCISIIMKTIDMLSSVIIQTYRENHCKEHS